MPLRVGVLVSGRGSNLQALLEAIERGEVAAEVVVVISNHADAPALVKADARGIRTYVVERAGLPSRLAQNSRMAEILEEHQVDLVVLAGYDRILDPVFVRRFGGRIINVHPSLLPAFGGSLKAQAAALEHGVKISGCTVHYVTDELDAGPIISQAAVPVFDDDTVESLSERILKEEHRLLPEAVDLIAKGCLRLEGRRVLRGQPTREPATVAARGDARPVVQPGSSIGGDRASGPDG